MDEGRTFNRTHKGNTATEDTTILTDGFSRAIEPGTSHLSSPGLPNNFSLANTHATNLPNQSPNFSSRNSLRAAHLLTNDGGSTIDPESPPNPITNEILTSSKMGVTQRDSAHYIPLSDDCFVKVIGSFIYCVLCGKRNRVVDKASLSNHVNNHAHVTNFRQLCFDLVNEELPPDSFQMRALGGLLGRWFTSTSLTNDTILARYHAIDEFNSILKSIDPSCSSRLLGSFLTGTALITSDVNLELLHPNSNLFESDPRAKDSKHHALVDPEASYGQQVNFHTLHYDLVPNALDTLFRIGDALARNILNIPSSQSFQISSSLAELNKKNPKLVLRHTPTKTTLSIGCYTGSAYKLSKLLNHYMHLDPRVQTLSILVKYWARICSIDNPDRGTFPPSTFVIFVIYFLQRTSPPVLPCLHELFSKNKRNPKSYSDETGLVEKLARVDIDQSRTNGQRELSTAESVDEPANQEPDVEDEEQDVNDHRTYDDIHNFDDEDVRNLQWESHNEMPMQKLFIDFLRMMCNEFHNISTVISIRTLESVSLKSKNWNTQVKSVENPIDPKINISRCIGTSRTYSFIRDCFKHSYYYLSSVPFDSNLQAKVERFSDPIDYIDLFVDSERLMIYLEMKEKSISYNSKSDNIAEMIGQGLFARDIEFIDRFQRLQRDESLIPKIVSNFYNITLLRPSDSDATQYCWLCRKNGHQRETCPKGKILATTQDDFDAHGALDFEANLDRKFMAFFKRDSITVGLSNKHKQIVQDLKKLINSSMSCQIELQLYGSTVNMMGSANSDLDICMTIKNNLTGYGVNQVEVLDRVSEILSKDPRARDIDSILTARVPIIRFIFDEFDIDLSMYNQCAIYNSMLLKEYASIDSRVASLFYVVKRYAKTCGIADASEGSLSSYAWTLLVVHYLQRTNPPILPVLQEPVAKTPKPVIGVNGWNVWFRKNLVAADSPKNPSNLTYLFKGFLLYYANFNYDLYVISIRTLKPISRFQKNWNNSMIAIEDPFELTYNLASRLDDSMAIFIINSFLQAYRHMTKLQRELITTQDPDSIAHRLFHGRAITESQPPYRGCRICRRIGHRLKDCPEKRRMPPAKRK